MGYILLVIAAVLNTTKSYCSKRVSNKVEAASDAVDVALARNLVCASIGAALLLISGVQNFYMPSGGWLICIISGISIGLNYAVWLLALKVGVFMLLGAVSSASFLIAVVSGVMFFGEVFTIKKGIAMILMCIAIVCMGRYQIRLKQRLGFVQILLLFLVFLTAGFTSVTQKWFTRTLPTVSAHTFSFYSIVFSVVFLALFSLFLPKTESIGKRCVNLKPHVLLILIMAACFYGVTYFQTSASLSLEAIVMYPLYNGMVLAAESSMAWLCFSEKPDRNSIIGVLLTFVAIILSR